MNLRRKTTLISRITVRITSSGPATEMEKYN